MKCTISGDEPPEKLGRIEHNVPDETEARGVPDRPGKSEHGDVSLEVLPHGQVRDYWDLRVTSQT